MAEGDGEQQEDDSLKILGRGLKGYSRKGEEGSHVPSHTPDSVREREQ